MPLNTDNSLRRPMLTIAVSVCVCSLGLSSSASSHTDVSVSSNVVPMYTQFRRGKWIAECTRSLDVVSAHLNVHAV